MNNKLHIFTIKVINLKTVGWMSGNESVECSVWTRDQDKRFENGLATFPEDSEDRWERIAADIPEKTIQEIKQHYQLLVDDIEQIESGNVPLPNYNYSAGRASRTEQDRRKGIAWSEEEHRLFLLGLEKYGKGDWRSISRNFVVTRTPTQVASHAQKYFIRLNSMNKDRRRSSIHDITNVNDVAVPQGPIIGQTNGSSGGSSGKPSKQVSQSPAAPSGVPMYGGTTIGQPVGGHLISAIGTPMIPPQHMAYGVRAPVPGQMVPGAMGPGAYPVPHSSAHR
ncbi:Transcription factor SRM1 [Heracleum sosnowskyi]|uniref:Transcription factor SRM1 n=1 Tax=Heracleum sosnowskyi TaxID=360622 RepID=A0AAD8MQ70_9APIA|nr:Transcription factor SRM1 [Heracleum sosnowskyi]